jgi:hypothetical protein
MLVINMEVGVIRRMLKRAKRWHQLGAEFRPLKEPRSISRALSYEEKLRLLRAAEQNEEWQRAQAGMSLALCTTMRGCEIKRLQWRDIDFLNQTILVRTSKTEAGERMIPMNSETLEMVMRLRERAKEFNGTEAQHFVFPPVSTATETLRGTRRALERHGARSGRQLGSKICASTTFVITPLPNWLNLRFPIKPSWRLLATSARRCWLAIRPCAPRHDGKRSWHSRQNRWQGSQGGKKRGLRHKERHKAGGGRCTRAGSD